MAGNGVMHAGLAALRLHFCGDWTNTRRQLRRSFHQETSQDAPTIFAKSLKANVGTSQLLSTYGCPGSQPCLWGVWCVSWLVLKCLLQAHFECWFSAEHSTLRSDGNLGLEEECHWMWILRDIVPLSPSCQALCFLFVHNMNSSFLPYTSVPMTFCPKCMGQMAMDRAQWNSKLE